MIHLKLLKNINILVKRRLTNEGETHDEGEMPTMLARIWNCIDSLQSCRSEPQKWVTMLNHARFSHLFRHRTTLRKTLSECSHPNREIVNQSLYYYLSPVP